MKNWYDKIARRFSRLAIPDLMKYIVLAMGAVFIIDFVTGYKASSLLMFDWEAIQQGQVWRLISFVFIPVNSSLIFILFSLYFYWMIGVGLEQEWGAARFNLFYLTGIVGTIIAGIITGYAVNFYLNLTLFLAFAVLFPNFEIRLFFFLPVKMKWLAWLDAAYLAYLLIISDWPGRLAIIVSLANFILFFWQSAWTRVVNFRRQQKWKNHFK
jgi:hypothetical protein